MNKRTLYGILFYIFGLLAYQYYDNSRELSLWKCAILDTIAVVLIVVGVELSLVLVKKYRNSDYYRRKNLNIIKEKESTDAYGCLGFIIGLILATIIDFFLYNLLK